MAEICFVPRLIQIASDFSRQAGKFAVAVQRSTVPLRKNYVYFINELRNGFIMKSPFKTSPLLVAGRKLCIYFMIISLIEYSFSQLRLLFSFPLARAWPRYIFINYPTQSGIAVGDYEYKGKLFYSFCLTLYPRFSTSGKFIKFYYGY